MYFRVHPGRPVEFDVQTACAECEKLKREIQRLREDNAALGREVVRQGDKLLKVRRALEA
jgi:hypothetical protein